MRFQRVVALFGHRLCRFKATGNGWPHSWPNDASSIHPLFGIRHLRSANDLPQMAIKAKEKSEIIIDKIINSNDISEIRLVLKRLDRVSDTLCQVLDLCEFVRSVHPDSAYQSNSNTAFEILYTYMNEINTSRPVYEVYFLPLM